MINIAKIIEVMVSVLVFAIFAQVMLSWIPGRSRTKADYILESITDPILKTAKMIPHRIGMIDLSPMIAVIGINIIGYILISIIQGTP